MTRGVGVLLVGACAAWAFFIQDQPSDLHEPVMQEQHTGQDPEAYGGAAPLDLSAFQVTLWNAPPPPQSEEPQSPPVRTARQPLTMQLIAITTDGDQRIAALFDPATDQLHLVTVGDSIDQLSITVISEIHVELDDGRGPRRLELTSASQSANTGLSAMGMR